MTKAQATKNLLNRQRKHKEQQKADVENLPNLMNMEELAAFMRISRAGVYTVARKYGFPKITIGKRIFVRRDSLLKWLNENEKQNGWGNSG